MRWGRVMLGIVAVVVLGAGCGGSTTDSAGTTVAVAPGETLAPGETVPSASDTVAPGPAPGDATSGQGEGGATATEAPGDAVEPEPDAIPPATPGNYVYDNTGHTKITGCTLVEDNAPPPSSVRVDAPAGARQQSVRDDGQTGTTTTVLEYRADGAYLVSLAQVTQAFSVEFRPPEPVLAAPRSPVVGQQLHFVLVSTDGKMQADTTITTQALDEAVALGDGSTAAATRALTTAHVTGPSALGNVDLTVNSVGWVAAALRMSVQSVSDTAGTVGLCNIESHIESVLRSGTPATRWC